MRCTKQPDRRHPGGRPRGALAAHPPILAGLLVLLLGIVTGCAPPAAPAATAPAAPPASAPAASAPGSGAAAPAGPASAPTAAASAPTVVAQPVNPPVKVRVDTQGIAAEAPMFLALDRGYFTELGIELDPIRMGSSGD